MFSIIPYYTGRNLFDAFAEELFTPIFGKMSEQSRPMKVDVREDGDRFVLEAEMPGIDKENISVSIKDGTLTVSASYGEEKKTDETDGSAYICRERRCGSMSRSFTLEGIDEAAIAAEFKNGVLTLILPKAAPLPEPEARAIEIA